MPALQNGPLLLDAELVALGVAHDGASVPSRPRRLDCRRLRGSDRQESLDLRFGVFLSDLHIEMHAVLAHLLLAHALEASAFGSWQSMTTCTRTGEAPSVM